MENSESRDTEQSHIIEINSISRENNEIIDLDKIKKEVFLLPLFKNYFNNKQIYNQFVWKEVYNTYLFFKFFNSYFIVLFYLIFNIFYFIYLFINTQFSLYFVHAFFCLLNVPLIYTTNPRKFSLFNFYYIICLIFILSSNGTFIYNFLFGIILINLHKNIIKNSILLYNNNINNIDNNNNN